MSDPAEIRKLILAAGSRMVRVVFVKRTNGERRSMTFRMGVKKGLKGKLEFDPRLAAQDAEHDLIRVWDVQLGKQNPEDPDKAYRFVSLDSVISLKCGEIQYPGRSKV